MKPLIVLIFLVAGCIPLPYVGDIVNLAAQGAQEQAREDERQAAQAAQARAQAEQQARWQAAQQAHAAAEAARRQQEAQRHQEAARMRWQAAQVSPQPPEAAPASAAEVRRTETPAAAFAVDQPTASRDDPLTSDAQPRVDLAPLPPPPTVATNPPSVRPASADPDSLSDNSPPRRQPTTSRPSRRLEQQQRKPAPSAKRYEVIQVLMCNDGTESPTCTCGGPRRGCCSHHGGVSGCESRRIPLGPEP